ncbi:MAG: tyrosine recombinase [Bacilli bacterium]|nr:tyrosine recombinase [Bacilli bacterium]
MKNEFLEYIKNEKMYSSNTYSTYERIIDEYTSFLKKEGIQETDITIQVIRGYLRTLYDNKYSSKSMCLYISALRSYHKFLLKKKIITSNPMSLIKNPKLEKRNPKFLNYNDLDSIYDAIDKTSPLGIRDNLIIELFYSTGVRVSELVNIKLEDINEFDMTIRILGKGNKERIVLYGETLKEKLNLYLNKVREKLKKENSDYLLFNKNGTKLTDRGVRKIIDKIVKKTTLNEKISPHIIRHTFATHLLKEGADLRMVQELLGHSSLAATQVYTHITNEQLRNVYLKTHPRAKEK